MIPQLTDHQVRVLKDLATEKVETFCSYTSVPADGDSRDVVDAMFHDVLTLIEMGLVLNVSDYPRYADLVKQYRDEEDRTLILVKATPIVKKMFRKGPWLKHKN